MKIFVGYGYNERDLWIEKMVFPLINAFGIEYVSGKEVAGLSLGDAVQDLIKKSNALIGFTTKRGDADKSGEMWGTHRWVTDELTTAYNLKVPFVEVREKGITPQTGMLTGRGYIEYEDGKRDECLVKIAQRVGGWLASGGQFEWHLLPDEFARGVSPRLNDANLKCFYQVIGPEETMPGPHQPGTIIPVEQGLAVRLRDVPNKSMIKIWVECGNSFYWESHFQPVDKRMIHLSEIKRQ